jgi:hypothetical protein
MNTEEMISFTSALLGVMQTCLVKGAESSTTVRPSTSHALDRFYLALDA